MTTVNTNPLDLMGKTISFKDMELEQRIANRILPEDFPDSLKDSSFVHGTVISVSFELDGKNQICVATDFPKMITPIILF